MSEGWSGNGIHLIELCAHISDQEEEEETNDGNSEDKIGLVDCSAEVSFKLRDFHSLLSMCLMMHRDQE